MHSSIERVLLVSRKLPEHLRVIFDDLFVNNKPVDVICQEQGITREELTLRETQIAREMRAANA
jgi:hypothetical protein